MKSPSLGLADKSLGRESDSWHEYNLQVAIDFFAKLSDEDWNSLGDCVTSRPGYWQERCAEVLGDLGDVRGVPVLSLLITSRNMVVASIAASQLNDMSISLPLTLKPFLHNLLSFLQASGSNRVVDVVGLLEKLRD